MNSPIGEILVDRPQVGLEFAGAGLGPLLPLDVVADTRDNLITTPPPSGGPPPPWQGGESRFVAFAPTIALAPTPPPSGGGATVAPMTEPTGFDCVRKLARRDYKRYGVFSPLVHLFYRFKAKGVLNAFWGDVLSNVPLGMRDQVHKALAGMTVRAKSILAALAQDRQVIISEVVEWLAGSDKTQRMPQFRFADAESARWLFMAQTDCRDVQRLVEAGRNAGGSTVVRQLLDYYSGLVGSSTEQRIELMQAYAKKNRLPLSLVGEALYGLVCSYWLMAYLGREGGVPTGLVSDEFLLTEADAQLALKTMVGIGSRGSSEERLDTGVLLLAVLNLVETDSVQGKAWFKTIERYLLSLRRVSLQPGVSRQIINAMAEYGLGRIGPEGVQIHRRIAEIARELIVRWDFCTTPPPVGGPPILGKEGCLRSSELFSHNPDWAQDLLLVLTKDSSLEVRRNLAESWLLAKRGDEEHHSLAEYFVAKTKEYEEREIPDPELERRLDDVHRLESLAKWDYWSDSERQKAQVELLTLAADSEPKVRLRLAQILGDIANNVDLQPEARLWVRPGLEILANDDDNEVCGQVMQDLLRLAGNVVHDRGNNIPPEERAWAAVVVNHFALVARLPGREVVLAKMAPLWLAMVNDDGLEIDERLWALGKLRELSTELRLPARLAAIRASTCVASNSLLLPLFRAMAAGPLEMAMMRVDTPAQREAAAGCGLIAANGLLLDAERQPAFATIERLVNDAAHPNQRILGVLALAEVASGSAAPTSDQELAQQYLARLARDPDPAVRSAVAAALVTVESTVVGDGASDETLSEVIPEEEA